MSVIVFYSCKLSGYVRDHCCIEFVRLKIPKLKMDGVYTTLTLSILASVLGCLVSFITLLYGSALTTHTHSGPSV